MPPTETQLSSSESLEFWVLVFHNVV